MKSQPSTFPRTTSTSFVTSVPMRHAARVSLRNPTVVPLRERNPTWRIYARKGCFRASMEYKNHVAPYTKNNAKQIYRVDPSLVATDSWERLRGFIKTRGSLDAEEDIVFYFEGDVYAVIDGAPAMHVFGIEGCNVGRVVPVDGGWRLLSREVAVHVDKDSREIISTWDNPYTELTDTIVHVWNDPVNNDILHNAPVVASKFRDNIIWSLDAFPRYKSPLPAREFPAVGGPDVYESAELFTFITSQEDIASDNPSASTCISWSRIGPWLPWMRMGTRPGRLVYHCRGEKVQSGFSGVPTRLRDYILKHNVQFSKAPLDFSRPNETSWSYMRKLIERKGYPRADGRIAPVQDKSTINSHKKAQNKTTKKENDKQMLKLSRKQLEAFRGRYGDEDSPIYISVSGKIFDVSSARKHYGFGETYNSLTGTDASTALITGSLSEGGDTKLDLEHLDAEQRETLNKWVEFFDSNYNQVGILTDE